ncbi:MAG TPA: efflux RND transporter periplasmic adaptor subunit [Gemmatimonadales bacterium]|nr:efflux RND transporter periplasmic adaptor subunit [Gemmatimonadales bacterium]
MPLSSIRPARYPAPVLGALLFLSACGADPAPAAGARGPADSIAVPVEFAVARLDTAGRSVSATGTVEPLRSVAINSQLSGSVLAVNVEEGDRVRVGTVLARIDIRELAAQLASAEASLEVARRTAERSKRLLDQAIITVAEFERDEAAHIAARAINDQLQARVAQATARSPIAGTVLERRVDQGDIVPNQTRMFIIGDISQLVVRVPISELDVTALGENDVVNVRLDALPGTTVIGRVRRIFPAADSTTRLVPVEIALTGPEAREVRPGFLARVELRLQPRVGVLVVPAAALIEQSGGTAVFTVENGRAVRRSVRRGEYYGERVEVLSGIAAGDTVVTTGATTLRDGAALRFVSAPELATPDAPRPQAVRHDTIGAEIPEGSRQ